MAETKPKKSAPKTFDIAKPGKSAPSSTSRPVIITNRPVLRDPMVIQVNSDSDSDNRSSNDSTTDTAKMKHEVDIQPLHIDLSEVLHSNKAPETEPKATLEVTDESEVVNEAEAPVATNQNDTVPETLDEAAVEPEQSTPTEPDVAAEPAVEPDLPKIQKPADDEPEETSADHEPEAPAEFKVPEDTAPAVGDGEGTVLSERDAKAADAAKKKAEAQEKIIASGEYYLPINAASKRRTKRKLILGSLLFIALVALAALATWDMGLFSIPGVQAPTNFL